MNTFCFTGSLGRDAEVRPAGSTSVCNFSVAVNSGFGDRKTTTWVNCALFGKRAEGGLPPYLTKGTQVGITGELTLRKYQKDGGEGVSLDVNVNTVDLVGGGKRDEIPTPQQDNYGDGATGNDVPF